MQSVSDRHLVKILALSCVNYDFDAACLPELQAARLQQPKDLNQGIASAPSAFSRKVTHATLRLGYG